MAAKSTKSTKQCLAALALLAATPWASAGLVGTNTTIGYHYLGVNYVNSLAVVAGNEITCPTGTFAMCTALTAATQTVDVGDNYLAYDFTSTTGNPSGFNNVMPSYFVFEDLQAGGAITGFALSTNIVGLVASRVSFNAGSVYVDMHDLPLGFAGSFRIDLSTAQGLPEPGSLMLAFGALGLVGLLGAARRRP